MPGAAKPVPRRLLAGVALAHRPRPGVR